MVKLMLFVTLMGSLSSMLLQAVEYVPRGTALFTEPRDAAHISSVPMDFEHTGADPEYVHGPHCIDGRTF